MYKFIVDIKRLKNSSIMVNIASHQSSQAYMNPSFLEDLEQVRKSKLEITVLHIVIAILIRHYENLTHC